ncbi:uncharacterized protein G2W53_030788 [Senna tora]|uniref:Uncharacterized protein n=1 Tax=Senna tora TaxID=362788 RepID=A0A834T737_9FABA|nr:uncharacterized protein G2W53_030788 [Senna tora]
MAMKNWREGRDKKREGRKIFR